MVGLSVPELVLIGAIALVVFGPSKLPEVGSAVGKAISEFKKSMNEVNAEPESKAAPLEQKEEPKQIQSSAEPAKESESKH